MKFTKIMGTIDPNMVDQAEKKLSQVFLELGLRYDNKHAGTGLGGDPLIFSLVYPMQHVCTQLLPTAATDGTKFFWNPKFVIKASRLALRIYAGHEAWHALYMHPRRLGFRNPRLWNIAVDYIVDFNVMQDLTIRGQNASETFTKECGKYIPLKTYAEFIKDPYNPPKGFEFMSPFSEYKMPNLDENRDPTEEEKRLFEQYEKKEKCYYADPDLPEDMRSPEKIYAYLWSLLPKCPTCGSVGYYKKPSQTNKPKKGKGNKGDKKKKDEEQDNENEESKKKKNKKNEEQDNENEESKKKNKKGKDKSDQCEGCSNCDGDDDDGDEQKCDCGGDQQSGDQQGGDQQGDGEGDQQGDGDGECPNCSGCPTCGAGSNGQCGGDGFDVFGLGDTLDDHVPTKESEEKLAKRLSDAIEASKRMAGSVPAALEDELGLLTAPQVTWQDIIRTKLLKSREGHGRNDWTKFKTRPIFAGLMVPKRKNYFASFGCLLDTSGSMSKDDMTFGLSQLISLDERAEGTIVPADAEIYWDKSTKIKKATPEQILNTKIVGRGGTMFSDFFSDYEDKIGKCDFLIVITDGYLFDDDVKKMKDPKVDVVWLITSGASFTPPFGRVFDLRN